MGRVARRRGVLLRTTAHQRCLGRRARRPRRACGDEGATAISEALPQCPALQHLWLRGCKIGDAGGLAIAEALPRCEPLKELELRDDSLSEATQAALRDKALPTLTTLRLSAEPVLRVR